MYRYKVNATCYVNGILRTPGGKHDPVRTPVKLDPMPSSLTLIPGKTDDTPGQQVTETGKAEKNDTRSPQQKAADTRKRNKEAKELEATEQKEKLDFSGQGTGDDEPVTL